MECVIYLSAKQTNNIAHGVRAARTHTVAFVHTQRPNLVRLAFVLKSYEKTNRSFHMAKPADRIGLYRLGSDLFSRYA